MIGPLPPPVGGARVLFSNFVKSVSTRDDTIVNVIETWKPNSLKSKLKYGGKAIIKTFKIANDFDIITYWSSERGMLLFGPIVNLICVIHKKPWIMRMFGRADSIENNKLGIGGNFLAKHVFLNSDLSLFETFQSINFFRGKYPAAEIAWHGNYRTDAQDNLSIKKNCSRFIFLGKVKEDKGVVQIVQAAKRFPEGIIAVDIYGPLADKFNRQVFDDCHNVDYKGIIKPEKVPQVLSNYDALLLPTYYPGEGIPGAIIEAYMAGLPVIASNWKSIPDIVDESCGILVEPRNEEDLFHAMNTLVENPHIYQKLAKGTKKRREEFSITGGVDLFLKYCQEVLKNRGH